MHRSVRLKSVVKAFMKMVRSRLRFMRLNQVSFTVVSLKAWTSCVTNCKAHSSKAKIIHHSSSQSRFRGSVGCRKYCSTTCKACFFPSCNEKAMQQAMRAGAIGIKVSCSGRLGGADMSRCEWFRLRSCTFAYIAGRRRLRNSGS